MKKLGIISGIILIIVLGLNHELSRNGVFNNSYDSENALLENSIALERRLGQNISNDEVLQLVELHGGTCQKGVKKFVLNGRYKTSTGGVLFCSVDQVGRIRFPPISYRWDCAFDTVASGALELIGCQRIGGFK